MAATKQQREKMDALLRLQNTNGSFEFNEKFAQVIGQNYDKLKKEMNEKRFDGKAWATTLAMEYIDKNLKPLKEEKIKEFDKAKLFVFKLSAATQPLLKQAAGGLLALSDAMAAAGKK